MLPKEHQFNYYTKSNVVVNVIPMNVTVIDAPDAPGSAIVTIISSGVIGIPAVVPEPPDPIPFTPLQAKILAVAALDAKAAPST